MPWSWSCLPVWRWRPWRWAWLPLHGSWLGALSRLLFQRRGDDDSLDRRSLGLEDLPARSAIDHGPAERVVRSIAGRAGASGWSIRVGQDDASQSDSRA